MRSLAAILSGCLLPVFGCAGGASSSSGCTFTTDTFNISPASGSADHSAAAPGNQVRFQATSTPKAAGYGCAVPAVIAVVSATWTTSDPLNTSVSSAAGSANGLATCTGSTPAPATVTATVGSGSSTQTATATLTCQ